MAKGLHNATFVKRTIEHMPRILSGWTLARRIQHAERIRLWKPWGRSTGPNTPAGKVKSSKNAMKHGERTAHRRRELSEIRAQLKRSGDTLNAVKKELRS
jgi:hypothetical protein